MNLVIDANNLLFRTYCVAEKNIESGRANPHTNDDGVDCAYIHKFISNLRYLIIQFRPTSVYLCWDKKLKPGNPFRQKFYPDYKANRDPVRRETITAYADAITEITRSLGFKNIYPFEMEADDIIWWLCENLKGKTIICTSDKDLFQLISPQVSIYNFPTKSVIDLQNFEETVGIDTEHFILAKCIMGDTSDNIMGLVGYGEKKSKKLALVWEDKKDDLTDEQLDTVDINLKIMRLGEIVGDTELHVYKTQFDKKPSVDFDKFKNKLSKEFRFGSSEISNWKTLLAQINSDNQDLDILNQF